MENFGLQVCQLLPGFRFHPTDQELIIHYLRKKVLTSSSTPATTSIIADIDLYKYNPWELPDKSLFFGELAGEWFFFSPRDRKYPNGGRPNRAAGCGYWKATGTDKPILAGSGGGSKCLGVKKALVFYKGRPPKGFKTDWVMHEYRLIDATPNPNPSSSTHNYKHKATNSMRLDDWVLCRVRQKGCTRPIQSDEKHDLQLGISTAGINQQVPAAPMIINNSENKQQLPAVKAAGNSTCTVSAGVINNSSSSSSDFYEWSEDQLLAYLMSSSSQQEEAEAEGLGESTCTSTDHNSRSTNSSSLCLNNNNNISNFLQQGHAAAAAATNHYMQPPPPPPQAAVSSMLDSIKRTLSFGALDELLMLQPPSKSLHYYYYINANGDDQLSSPTSSFSVDQAFPDFGM